MYIDMKLIFILWMAEMGFHSSDCCACPLYCCGSLISLDVFCHPQLRLICRGSHKTEAPSTGTYTQVHAWGGGGGVLGSTHTDDRSCQSTWVISTLQDWPEETPAGTNLRQTEASLRIWIIDWNRKSVKVTWLLYSFKRNSFSLN